MCNQEALVWREAFWPNPFTVESGLEVLTRIATDPGLGTIVSETRTHRASTRFLIACLPTRIKALTALVTSLVPGIQIAPLRTPRNQVSQAGRIVVGRSSIALSSDRPQTITRALLGALSRADTGDREVVLQVVLGGRLNPKRVPDKAGDPAHSWWGLLTHGAKVAATETKTLLRQHSSRHGFKTVLRIGVNAPSTSLAKDLGIGVLAAIRTAEIAGSRLELLSENPRGLNQASRPFRYPMGLPVHELVGLLAWPIGEGDLPGLGSGHPRLVAPPPWVKDENRSVLLTNAPGRSIRLGIPVTDSLEHTVVTGPTGSGKSTVLLNLIISDIEAGLGCVVVDPKADLISDILARIPAHRRADVVLLNPLSNQPVGLNPLTDTTGNPELLADALLASFRSVFADTWGIRTEEVMGNALIDLARIPGSTLIWLPRLLSDPAFRANILAKVHDPLGTGAFWTRYEAMTPAAQATLISPTLNKLHQFTVRPTLRAVLGQASPKFSLSDVFTKRRILLVPLNKGVLGGSSRLLGSLLISQLWVLALGRAAQAPGKRHITNVYIDEVQDYLALPTNDLGDALAQARSLGLGFHAAHQYRKQLSPEMLAAFDTNARSKITFALSASDAAEMAKMAPDLAAEDFMLLPRYGVYANLMNQRRSTGWVSGMTIPKKPACSDPAELAAASASRYGTPLKEVEAQMLQAAGLTTNPDRQDNDTAAHIAAAPIGRRKTEPEERHLQASATSEPSSSDDDGDLS